MKTLRLRNTTAINNCNEEGLDFDNEENYSELSRLLEDFIQSADSEEKKEEVQDEDDDEEEEEEDVSLPDGEVELNPTTTVRVQILKPIKNPQRELDKLVGCSGIKQRIDELITLSRYNKMLQAFYPQCKRHDLSLHGIFTGKPGTGKTTVCKIYGSLLHHAGVLSKGHVVQAGRGVFIGCNWGDEERVVREVVGMARGGVLMIDEAYLLCSDNKNDPGRLVIPLLMDILADEKERDLAIVLCGYKDKMERVLELNPGLTSRFPNRFEFPDFSLDELLEITRRRIGEYNYHFTRTAWAKYKEMLAKAYDIRDDQTWGNARFVANQLERIYVNHARRCMNTSRLSPSQMLMITPADIQPIEVPRHRRPIGF